MAPAPVVMCIPSLPGSPFPQQGGDGSFEVVDDLLGDLLHVPDRHVILPGAVLHLVVGVRLRLPVAVAERQMEHLVAGVVEQAEELHRLDEAHQAGALRLLDGPRDEKPHVVPQYVEAVICGNLHHGIRRLGYLPGLPVQHDEALGGFRAEGEEVGNAHAERPGYVLDLRYGGVALDAGQQIADGGAHPGCDVGELQALGPGDLPEVLFNVGHNVQFRFRHEDTIK